MLDYTRYTEVFPAGTQLPYDKKLQQQIEAHRKAFDGTLFIDRVLTALGITKAKSYPPKTENALKTLHQQICDAGMSLHHKLSLLYYILLDFEGSSNRQSPAEDFAIASGVPNNYQIFMKGLWYMDRRDLSTAIEYIAHPSLVADFADDIIVALVRHAPKQDYSLALSYFHTVQPALKTSAGLGSLFEAMSNTSLSEALLYSRTHAEHTRQQLFQRLVTTGLESPQGSDKGSRLQELAFLQFDAIEEAWLEQFLLHGEGRNMKKAKDIMLTRQIASNKFTDLNQYKANGDWAPIIQGIKGGIEGHAD